MSTQHDQAQIAYRDSVNWRSVTRADPAVQQILNTCTFCSVFIFDVAKDEWVKQKQEGPLFLVRRNKEPEYGLYMLNRATVKNVLWPLIPGEMRVTPTSDSMLIVERRGEGIKTGIHFGDGMAVVEEFRATVVSICGDPRQKSGSAPPPTAQNRPQSGLSNHVHQPSPAPPPTDDLTRLFAGITVQSGSTPRPASSGSRPHIAPQAQGNGSYTSEIKNPQPSTSYRGPGHPSATTPVTQYSNNMPAKPDTPPTPPITFSKLETPASPARSPEPSHPPGQTVEDLLSSLLGGSGSSHPPTGPPPMPSGPTPPFTQPQPQLQRPTSVTHQMRPIQALPTPPPQQPMPPILVQQFGIQPPIQDPPSPISSAQRPRDRPPHLDGPAPQDVRSHLQEAIISSLPSGYRPVGQPLGPDPRLAFQRDLVDMIQRDPVFVDQIFRSFQARRG